MKHMNNTLKLIFSLTFICSNIIHSQITISGKILEEDSNLILVYADVYVLNTSLGVITNDDGEFTLSVPEAYKDYTLAISSLGYEKLKIPINNLTEKNENVFYLKPKSEKLNEVVISSLPNYTERELLTKALNKYSNDFFQNQYIAKGFIRHSEKTKESYKLLVEAAFEMYEPGNNNNNKVGINLLQTRKSFDNRILDTVFVIVPYLRNKNNSSYNKNHEIAKNYKENLNKQEIDKAIAFYDNHYTAGYNKELGLLEKILTKDINKLRNYNSKRATLTDKTIKDFIIKKDTVLYLDDEKITKISFTLPNKKAGNILVGSIYIRNSDLAILETNFSSLTSKSHSYYRATGNRVRYSTKMRYREFKGLMYPFYMSHKSFKFNGINQHDGELLVDGTYTLDEILLSQILIDEKSFNVFKSKLKTNNNIFNKTKYDKDFWNTYPILLESNEENKMIKDLERKVKLKKQFQDQ